MHPFHGSSSSSGSWTNDFYARLLLCVCVPAARVVRSVGRSSAHSTRPYRKCFGTGGLLLLTARTRPTELCFPRHAADNSGSASRARAKRMPRKWTPRHVRTHELPSAASIHAGRSRVVYLHSVSEGLHVPARDVPKARPCKHPRKLGHTRQHATNIYSAASGIAAIERLRAVVTV